MNPDNKTTIIKNFNLLNFKKLIESNPSHIASVTQDSKPNLCIASDVLALDEKTALVSNNEMNKTPIHVLHNPNIILTCFDNDFNGIRMTGTAIYHTNGTHFDIANKEFKSDTTTPKGVLAITVTKLEQF